MARRRKAKRVIPRSKKVRAKTRRTKLKRLVRRRKKY